MAVSESTAGRRHAKRSVWVRTVLQERTTLHGVKDPQQLILSIANRMARKIFIGGNWKCVGCAWERDYS